MDIYKRTLDEVGKPLPDDLPMMREIFVAHTRDEAIKLARPYLEAKYRAYHEWGQDKAMPEGDDDLGLISTSYSTTASSSARSTRSPTRLLH